MWVFGELPVVVGSSPFRVLLLYTWSGPPCVLTLGLKG